jgi:ABC-2 type transport system permease protein
MSSLSGAGRELRLLSRDRAFAIWVVLALLLSTLSVLGGIDEVAQQRATLARLVEADRVDRADAHRQHPDWGGAAYYGFHLTYDPPSDFAFAALGVRDQAPWKHRVRMLALEGQIYARDAGNPVLALVGRFDFAFFAAYVVPLLLIVVLHDLQTSERTAGRHALLVSTAREGPGLWRLRAMLRVGTIALVALLPLLLGCAWTGTQLPVTLAASALFLAYCAFWGLLAFWMAARPRSSEQILSTLVGLWLLLGIVGPALGKLAIDRVVAIPEGSDILMIQREAVNDAWDLPKEVTMDAFVAQHPEWARYAQVEQPFHWKWYYAFQQVGDQKAAALSEAYRSGRRERDRLAALAAWLMPPALLERALQRLAATDLRAQMDYEQKVRDFHAELRAFYYARLFPEKPFAAADLEELPEFPPAGDS